mmetsp:Transcript_71749/g.215660  ORF Transcript_71749/g.215660 Transcript_71749/m.215660 type:complete len:235 (+) Transcript_71749:181-885(+)
MHCSRGRTCAAAHAAARRTSRRTWRRRRRGGRGRLQRRRWSESSARRCCSWRSSWRARNGRPPRPFCRRWCQRASPPWHPTARWCRRGWRRRAGHRRAGMRSRARRSHAAACRWTPWRTQNPTRAPSCPRSPTRGTHRLRCRHRTRGMIWAPRGRRVTRPVDPSAATTRRRAACRESRRTQSHPMGRRPRNQTARAWVRPASGNCGSAACRRRGRSHPATPRRGRDRAARMQCR